MKIVRLPKEFCHIFVYNNGKTVFLIDKLNFDFYKLANSEILFSETRNCYTLTSSREIINDIEYLAHNLSKNFVHTSSSYRTVSKLTINLAQICGLNCIYCYAKGGIYNKEGIMNLKTLEIVLNFFTSNFDKIHLIQLFGGEPLLNLRAIDFLLEYLNAKLEKKPKISIITGLFVKKNVVEDFVKLIEKYEGTFDFEIIVSIDGPKEITDYLRPSKDTNSSFNTISENLMLLKRINMPNAVEITYTMYHVQNKISILELYKYFYDNFELQNLIIVPVKTTENSDLFISNEYYYIMMTVILKELFNKIEKKEDLQRHEKIFIKNLIRSIFLLESDKITEYFCEAGINSYTVDIDGTIYPCQLVIGMDEHKIGNILTEDESSINLKVENYRKKTIEFSRRKNYSQCCSCYFTYYCGKCIFDKEVLINKNKLFDDCNYQKKIFEFILQHDPWKIFSYVKDDLKC